MITPRDGAESWQPDEPAPSNFNQAAFQQHIDQITGTRDGRSLIKLVWAPSEKRWSPHPHGDEPVGYQFPIFVAYTTADGVHVAAPRWVLLERIEPEQFAPTWEASRYTREDDGRLWDWKGPCPSEYYAELRCITSHDGLCCPCLGDTCECGIDYDHCWGRYIEPSEATLNWVRQVFWESVHDRDVNPTGEVTATNIQQQLAATMLERQEQKRARQREFNQSMLSFWERRPHSIVLPN